MYLKDESKQEYLRKYIHRGNPEFEHQFENTYNAPSQESNRVLFSSDDGAPPSRTHVRTSSAYATPSLPPRLAPTTVPHLEVYRTRVSRSVEVGKEGYYNDEMLPLSSPTTFSPLLISPTPPVHLPASSTTYSESPDKYSPEDAAMLAPGRYRRDSSLEEFLKYIGSGKNFLNTLLGQVRIYKIHWVRCIDLY